MDNDITDTSVRLKVLLINEKNIILGYERGIYQFPGGHLEDGENFSDCIKRELMEETGILIHNKQINEPIFKLTHMTKDYPVVGNNRKSEVYYYVIETDMLPDISKTNYTEHERNGNFKLEIVPIVDVIKLLEENIKNNNSKLCEIISKEMIMVMKEYFKIKNLGDDKSENKSWCF